MADDRCPRCKSSDIIGKTFGMGGSSIVEFGCHACGFADWFDTRNDGYDEWRARWSGAARTRRKPAKKPPQKTRLINPRRGALAPLFDAVLASPWDDAPRLRYADAIEKTQPTRAQWIRVMIEQWKQLRGLGSPDYYARDVEQARWKTERDAAALKDGWGKQIEPFAIRAAPVSYAREFDVQHGYGFERGFVSYVRTTFAHVRDVFRVAPIEHLRIDDAAAHLEEILALPELAQLKSFLLGWSGVRDEHVPLIVRSPLLARCQWLGLQTNELTHKGVAALLECEAIRKLPVVLLAGNPCDPSVQVGYDCHGTIAQMFLPAEGEAAEARFGRIDWLHLSHSPDFFYPRRLSYWD